MVGWFVNEGELQRAVIALARTLGWRVAHFRPAQVRPGRYVTPVEADGAGFPDLVLARDRVVFAELKQAGKKPAESQEAWLNALELAGAEVYVWKPRDWRDGTIEAILKRREQ